MNNRNWTQPALALCAAATLSAATPALGGNKGPVLFDISNGTALPKEDFAAKVSVIGCSWATKDGDLGPITVELHVGDQAFAPFGEVNIDPYSSYSGTANPGLALPSNVNTGGMAPRHLVVQQMFDKSEQVTVTAHAWEYYQSISSTPYVLNSQTQSSAVMVLRDGDEVPEFETNELQTPIEVYLKPYTNHAGTHLMLHPNQAIYLFDFNAATGSGTVDYQDLVVIMTFGDSVEELENNAYAPIGNLGTTYD